MNTGRFILQSQPTELALTCVDSMQRGRDVTGLLSSRWNDGFSCSNLHVKVHLLFSKHIICTRLYRLWCMHSALTKIATIPIETCTSAGVLRHTFYPSRRPDVISLRRNKFHASLSYVKMTYLTSFQCTFNCINPHQM